MMAEKDSDHINCLSSPKKLSVVNISLTKSGISCLPPLYILSISEFVQVLWMLSQLPSFHMCSFPAMCRKHCVFEVTQHLLFLQSFHFLSCNDIWALGGQSVLEMSHLELSILDYCSLHLDQLWVSGLTAIYFKKNVVYQCQKAVVRFVIGPRRQCTTTIILLNGS